LIHETAIIGEGSKIHPTVEIGPLCIIGPGTVIEEGAELGEYVRTGKNARIGKRAVLKCRAIMGPDCVIGDDTFFGPECITLRVTLEREHAPVTIGNNCFIAGAVMIGPGVTICDNVTVGAMSYVHRDITEEGLYFGIPAKFKKEM